MNHDRKQLEELARTWDPSACEIVRADQPAPRPSTGDVWGLVLQDMEQRREAGIERYGAPLQPHNGRAALWDAYEEALSLGRRAVASKGWRWLAGMLARRQTGPCSGSYRYTDDDVRTGREYVRGVPDFGDPCTLGGLLALAREAWGHDGVCVTYMSGMWSVFSHEASGGLPTGHLTGWHTTEAEALVAALEAAL